MLTHNKKLLYEIQVLKNHANKKINGRKQANGSMDTMNVFLPIPEIR